MQDAIVVNGITIPDERLAALTEFKVDRTIDLPSGKVATFRKGVGRDMMKAQKLLQLLDEEMTNVFALSCALASVLGRIDGKPFTYEDIMEMDIPEATALAGAASSPIILNLSVHLDGASNTPELKRQIDKLVRTIYDKLEAERKHRARRGF